MTSVCISVAHNSRLHATRMRKAPRLTTCLAGWPKRAIPVRPHISATAKRQSSSPAWGIHVKRDTQLSIAYSQELIFSMSVTLQSTDQHHGIVGQEHCHFQRDSLKRQTEHQKPGGSHRTFQK